MSLCYVKRQNFMKLLAQWDVELEVTQILFLGSGYSDGFRTISYCL